MKNIHSGLPSVPRVHEARTSQATYIKTNFGVLSGPKQLWSLANLGCIRSRYLLVKTIGRPELELVAHTPVINEVAIEKFSFKPSDYHIKRI